MSIFSILGQIEFGVKKVQIHSILFALFISRLIKEENDEKIVILSASFPPTTRSVSVGHRNVVKLYS